MTASTSQRKSFDGLYRVTRTTSVDPDGNVAVDTEYDDNGRVSRLSNPYRLGRSNRGDRLDPPDLDTGSAEDPVSR